MTHPVGGVGLDRAGRRGARPGHADDLQVLSIRGRIDRGEAPGFVKDALRAVRAYMQEHQMSPAGPPFSIVRAAGLGRVDAEAGWPLEHPVPGSGRIHTGALPSLLLSPRARPEAEDAGEYDTGGAG